MAKTTGQITLGCIPNPITYKFLARKAGIPREVLKGRMIVNIKVQKNAEGGKRSAARKAR